MCACVCLCVCVWGGVFVQYCWKVVKISPGVRLGAMYLSRQPVASDTRAELHENMA